LTPSFNIAALSRRTGVPADTIRKWEQRYGVLAPERTAGGQRRYTERDVSRVQWLKARIDEGFRIGEAADLLGGGESTGLTTAELCREIVDATERCDVQALTAAVEQALMLESVACAFTEVFAPALVEIGELWSRGKLTVAQEHLATAAIRSALQRLLADGRGNVRGVAVLACAPGELHELGLLMLGVLLHADGWQIAYLGPNTPLADAIALAQTLHASALCVSAGSTETARALATALGASKMPDSMQLLVGGRATQGPTAEAAVEQLRAAAA
jgi:methanogenic corrinoid protein MtbC1